MRSILFDLDGTLTDPKPGITRCIQHALRELGCPCPEADDLEWCIGPPLQGSFHRLLGSEDPLRGARALALYRERFSEVGLFENTVYDGIPDALHTLRESGYWLFVATSKPHVFAGRILDHFGLGPFFDGIYGSELDGTRVDKGELLAHLLGAEGLNADQAVMVGDREHDVRGAAQNEVRCIGATWGYGAPQELIEAGAAVLCGKPEELSACVMNLVRRR